jgi:CelD/BcsL family acetyltransferase involved in cellulose biosynthesis
MGILMDDALQISIVRGERLTPAHVERWSSIQSADPCFDSPFFRPEYTQLVTSVRSDVEVAVLQRDGEDIGFFPYHRTAAHVACPIGLTKTDFQGVIAGPDAAFTAEQLIRGCRLSAWHFNHLIVTQEPFARFHQLVARSPYIDLAHGYDAYRNFKRQCRSSLIVQTERKTRVLERELGAIRVVYGTTDAAILATLIEWKQKYYRRIQSVNHLSAPWQRALLEAVWNCRCDRMSGVLSVLYAGDNMLAIDLSIRSGAVQHSWCSSYDRAFGRYSPGMILLLKLVKSAATNGIRRIDLGRGEEDYKTRFLTAASFVAEGSVDFRPIAGPLRRARNYARELVRVSPLRRPAQTVVRSFRGWKALR